MIEQITDEIIALTVAGAGTLLAGWITYTTGEIPEFFSMGFGVVLAYYFGKKKGEASS